jgi:delta11-fatty-acid desaturase
MSRLSLIPPPLQSHHPFTSRAKLERLLAKYETTRPCELLDGEDRGEEFVWPQPEQKDADAIPNQAPISDFAQELVGKVRTETQASLLNLQHSSPSPLTVRIFLFPTPQVGDYFRAEAKRRGVPLLEATKATFARKIELTALMALFCMTLPAFFRGELWTLIAMPLAYWVIGVNIFHDGSHFALSRDWRINALATYWGWYFSSPFEWYHQHVIGHHVYANIPTKVRPDGRHVAK